MIVVPSLDSILGLFIGHGVRWGHLRGRFTKGTPGPPHGGTQAAPAGRGGLGRERKSLALNMIIQQETIFGSAFSKIIPETQINKKRHKEKIELNINNFF